MTLTELVTSGIGVFLITEIAKKSPFIPINEGQRTRIQTFAGVLSSLAVVLQGVAANNVAPDSLQQFILQISAFIGTMAAAEGVHQVRNGIKSFISNFRK